MASTRVDLDYRPSYLAALIAGTVVFILYVVTLAPTTVMWDTSEYIAAAYVLGLPHPPGNPFFVLIGRVFTLLPIAGSVAARVNMLAALCSAVSAGMWFLITERVLVGWFSERWLRITGGALAALIGATAFTVWAQSVVNEKVYTVSLAGVAIISWLTVRWCDDPDGPKSDRVLVLIAYLLGLGYANHMAGFLPGPAVATAVLIRRPSTLVRWKLLLACVAALVLGLTPFATQPIRAAYFPAINEGEPTGCTQKLELACTFSKRTYDSFMYNFNRGQYDKPPMSERAAPLTAQLGMWWFYFKWQWLRDAEGLRPRLQSMLAAFFLMLGLLGGYVHWRRDRRSFSYFGPLVFTSTLVLIYYLNFKYGASQAPQLGETVDREVRDRDYFYLWSFSMWSVWAALGLAYLWESLAAAIGAEQVKLGAETVEMPYRRSWLLSSPLLLVAFVPLFGNWKSASRHNDTDTRDFAVDMLNSVEPYGILVTVGDNDTFPLWYAQEVEGVRKDVIVANTSLLNTDWYTRQLIRRPIYEYDAAKGPAIYRGKAWTKPTKPALSLSFDDADRVPLLAMANDGTAHQMQAPGLTITVPPRDLFRADYLVLMMIRDAWPERPFYYSRTAGDEPERLGLGDHMLTQGLARKLVAQVPKATKDTIWTGTLGVAPGGLGWIDVARTKDLWMQFLAPTSLIRKGQWIDRPSAGIPYLYIATGGLLAGEITKAGQPALADSIAQEAFDIASAAGLRGLFQPQRTELPQPTGSLPPKAGAVPPPETKGVPLIP